MVAWGCEQSFRKFTKLLGCSVERFFGYLKDRTRVFYNNINPKKTLFTPLLDFLELFVHWYIEWR
jgi:hypothetical protein